MEIVRRWQVRNGRPEIVPPTLGAPLPELDRDAPVDVRVQAFTDNLAQNRAALRRLEEARDGDRAQSAQARAEIGRLENEIASVTAKPPQQMWPFASAGAALVATGLALHAPLTGALAGLATLFVGLTARRRGIEAREVREATLRDEVLQQQVVLHLNGRHDGVMAQQQASLEQRIDRAESTLGMLRAADRPAPKTDALTLTHTEVAIGALRIPRRAVTS